LQRRDVLMIWRRFPLLLLSLVACGSSEAGTGSPSPTAPEPGNDAPANDAPANRPRGGSAAVRGAIDDTDAPAVPLPPLPLRTDGRWIVDATGKRFKLTSVNWYGAEEKDYVVAGLDKAKLADVANAVRALGFNSVRIPWSNEMYETNPVVNPARVAANPELAGNHALDVLDRVIAALAHQGLLVILDNHGSAADWCCAEDDGNGLWHTQAYPETSWIADWKGIVERYASQPAVVAVDLRNELRAANGTAPVWGGGDPQRDWHAAAERGGNAVLSVNPKLLVMVEGLHYSTDFTGAYDLPVRLDVANRLVYSPHDYSWFHTNAEDYASLKTALGDAWGYLLTQGKPFTAPVWVGEFGTCHTADACVDAASGGGLWFTSFRRYLADADVDWSYWALNGTEATGRTRTLGAEETFGVLGRGWDAPALPALTSALAAMQPPTQGP
jgi:endoglucanase